MSNVKCYSQIDKLPDIDNRFTIVTEDTLIKSAFIPTPDNFNFHDNLFYYNIINQEIKITQGGSSGKLLHGKYEKLSPNKVLIESGSFKKGLKKGIWKEWYSNGNLKLAMKYRNGVAHGLSHVYDKNGKIKIKGRFTNGQKNGVFNEFNSEGKITDTTIYKKGVKQP